MGPPTEESVLADSAIAAFNISTPSAIVGGRPDLFRLLRSSGETLLEKNPEPEQLCGEIGGFAQIIGLPSKKPAEVRTTPLLFSNGT
jgi:hypothetical protein